MSDLTNSEKRRFEKLLGMAAGYVLDFTNRTFGEFVEDSTGRFIFDSKYAQGSGSKAHRLRAFWKLEANAVVGKLMADLLDCADNSGVKEECRRIVARLLQQSGPESNGASASPASKEEPGQNQRSKELSRLKEQFLQFHGESDRNRVGLELEKLLNRLFELFDLHPRLPFRVTGEQIDGSFQLDSHTYLLESKWVQHPLPEADLLVFRGKIEGKSTFTRGVLIAINDVSLQAKDALTRGKSPSFFVMNGHDLMMILGEAMSPTEFLRKRVRLLGEEGGVCVPFSELG